MPLPGSVRSVIVKQNVLAAQYRKVKIWPPVIVIVCTGNSFDPRRNVYPAGAGALRERPIAVVMVQLAPVRIIRIIGLIADEQVQPAITVKVEPAAGLAGMAAYQARLLRHVGKSPIPVVS